MLLSKHFHSSLDNLKNNVSDMKFPSLVITYGGTAYAAQVEKQGCSCALLNNDASEFVMCRPFTVSPRWRTFRKETSVKMENRRGKRLEIITFNKTKS